MDRILFILLLCSPVLLAQEPTFVPPLPSEKPAEQTIEHAPLAPNDNFIIASRDSILGDRIARVSATMNKIPQEHGQFWREFDITPYTQDRNVPAGGIPPEQVLVDWILRKTGTAQWHTAPFGLITADSEKLYVYHTKEVLLTVADIVDRFVCPQLWNESCTVRIVATSRPDWRSKGHSQLRPIPIATQGVQGWIMEKEAAQSLFQELSRRSDFRELLPPQTPLAHGIGHNVSIIRQRQYLRDVQPNASAMHGYAEDRVTIDEGIGLSITPLAMLDGRHMAATIKLDIIQVERMFTTMLEIATASNPRQRVHIESPQLAHFKLDEVVGFPKNRVLLLDLGTIPLPNTIEGDTRSVIEEISRGINPARRGNVLVFIEATSVGAIPAVNSSPSAVPVPARTARPLESPYWHGLR
ncbi:MAG: hypothetical protein FWG73_07800 [Planctomycetaceae bacterium]|nr:hypothetical protein [Planctomycetaceae bacterium]